MELPKQLSICPIVESIIEVRFSTLIHPEAVFGLFYQKLKFKYPNVQNLGINQLPDNIRNSDINLKYKPYYKLVNNNFIVQVGPEMFSISALKYPGWKLFISEFLDVYNSIKENNIINEILRIGIRYVNYFKEDIFENINLDLSIGNFKLAAKGTGIRVLIEDGSFSNLLQIANDVSVAGQFGSIIDIDTHIDIDPTSGEPLDLQEKLEFAHDSEKKLFFSLLKEQYIKSLNPVY